MTLKISQMTAAGALTGAELVEVSQLSTSVTKTATTISALASDNSYNDSGSGFVSAGFAIGDQVKVTGFTGNGANNIFSAKITALTAGKMTIGGTDGDVIVDDAAGESVTITKWLTRRVSIDDIEAAGGGSGSFTKQAYTTLTGKSSFAGTGSEQWGTEEATVDDASLPALTNIDISAILVGFAENFSSNANTLNITVEISIDGGSTWTAGQQTQYVRASGNSIDRAAIHGMHARLGVTVTGDIQARAMAVCGHGASSSYDLQGGAILLLVTHT